MVRKYEDDVRNRRLEEDGRLRRTEDGRSRRTEEELLRSSLRGSKKLQQLEHEHQQKRRKGSADVVDASQLSSSYSSHSQINPAFEPDFDSNVLPATGPLPELDAVVQRLSVHLNGDVKNVLTPDSRVSKLLSIYTTVMQEREKRLLIPTTSMPSTELVQEIIAMLQRLPLDVSLTVYLNVTSDAGADRETL